MFYVSVVDDPPELKYLNRNVRPDLCAACEVNPQAWKDLGIELMSDSAAAALSTISVNHNGNVVSCCSSLFSLWFERQPKASWRQLIEALKNINLEKLATQIEGQLIPSVDPGYTTKTAVSQGTYVHISSNSTYVATYYMYVIIIMLTPSVVIQDCVRTKL